MKAALYMRLSRDDDGEGESASISTQRAILTAFAEKNGLAVAGEYVDDGFTGTNFDRPAWKRLKAAVERGDIDCVLVKDLSRLGRNSARVNDLLDEFFPAHRVRCVSVVDGYDSANLSGGGAMVASFLPVVHELYARDISAKIRSALRAKMEAGRFIGSFAPYGYKKEAGRGGGNRLVPDERTAPFVRAIFRMAEKGEPPREIARKLNAWNVSPPAVCRRTGQAYLLPEDAESPRWTSSSVCRILGSETYLGRLTQGRTQKPSFKAKSARIVPREEWVRVDGAHEPLISEETFRIVRGRCVARRCPPTRGFRNVFAGVAVCADCGRAMTTAPSRKKGAVCNLCCGAYKARGATACSNHFIDYGALYDAVLADLNERLARARVCPEPCAPLPDAETEASAALRRRREELCLLQRRLYEDRAFGRVSEETYARLAPAYERELAALAAAEADMTREAVPQTPLPRGSFCLPELSPLAVRTFIDRIEVGQGAYVRGADGRRVKRQTVRLFYRFREAKTAQLSSSCAWGSDATPSASPAAGSSARKGKS